MSKNIYNEYVIVTKDLDVSLKKCLMTHLVIYNFSLTLLYDNPEMTFKTLMKLITGYIEEKKIVSILELPLMNELYYQYKKFKKNIKIQKLVTDIQYFTFISKGYLCKNLVVSEDRQTIFINGFNGHIELDIPLPEINQNETVYINLSYSTNTDKYKISVYKSY